MRTIQLLLYNAYVTEKFLLSYKYLMDTERCTTWKAYRKQSADAVGLSFRHWLGMMCAADLSEVLGNNVSAAMAITTNTGNVPLGEHEDSVSADTVRGTKRKLGTYKANTYANDDDMSRKRTTSNARYPHSEEKLRAQGAACPLCCQISNSASESKHYRKGFRPTIKCTTCNVTLCKVKRWDSDGNFVYGNDDHSRLSCWEIWHTFVDLPVLNDRCRTGGEFHCDGEVPEYTPYAHRVRPAWIRNNENDEENTNNNDFTSPNTMITRQAVNRGRTPVMEVTPRRCSSRLSSS
jgi:hypothetical protein